MEHEPLSAGNNVIGQGLIIAFIVLFYTMIGFLFGDLQFDFETFLILVFIFSVGVFIIGRILSFADVYVSPEHIICKKIIGTKKIPLSNIKTVKQALSPFTYSLEFHDGKKVFFQLKPGDMSKRFENLGDEAIIQDLKRKLRID